jgi:hypothetical protein
MPAASRFTNTCISGVMQPQSQGQMGESQTEKQRGGESLLDGVEGIPTSTESFKRCKKAACQAPKGKCKSTVAVRFNH